MIDTFPQIQTIYFVEKAILSDNTTFFKKSDIIDWTITLSEERAKENLNKLQNDFKNEKYVLRSMLITNV